MQKTELTGTKTQTVAPGVQITLNVDKLAFNEKPQGAAIGSLRNRLCNKNSIVTMTPTQLIAAIENGQTFTPAAMTGTSGTTWQEQQIIVADIDNDEAATDENGNKIKGKKQPIKQPLTSEIARQICRLYKIEPCFMYHTFSNGPQLEKYRIVFVLDQPITDREEALRITRNIAGLFNRVAPGCCDTTATDAARMLYGSRQNSAINVTGNITQLSALKALPDIEEPKRSATVPQREKTKTPITGTQREFYDRRRADIEAFDLEAYILQTEPGTSTTISGSTTYINPCPICGHTNDFSVTGQIWQCFSDSNTTGIKGGTIIDYLMARNNITLPEAMEKFNKIMGYELTPEEPEQTTDIDAETGDDLEAFLEKIQTETYRPHATGVNFLDALLNGGVENQTLNLIAAAPATGKTALCSQIAEAIARNGRPVIYFNFEMSKEQMLSRVISARLLKRGNYKMTAKQIRQGYKWNDQERALVTAEVEAYRQENRPRYIDANEITPELNNIVEYLENIGKRAEATETDAPAVFVDYLHLINSKGNDLQETIKETCIGLKEYSIKYNTFVFAILAVNRDSMKDGKPTLFSARDSSNIEYSADSFITLNFKAYDSGDIKPHDLEAMETYKRDNSKWEMVLRSLKDRSDGQAAAQTVLFDPAYMTFYATENAEQVITQPGNNDIMYI